MKFTTLLWESTKGIYDRILAMPFNQELMKGILSKDRFIFYLKQDSLYLMDYCRVLAVIASKLDNKERILQFLKFAGDCIVVEREMHEKFLSVYKKKHEPEKSPACFAYTNYLMATVAFKSIEESVASVLPCFWIYREVGDYIYKHADNKNPYRDWIETYAAEEFRQATDTAIEITDEMANLATEDCRIKMMAAFKTSVMLEYNFWESGYKKENWSV